MGQSPPEASRKELVRLLDEARHRHNVSVRSAARIAEVPAATMQGWLNGRYLPTPALHANFQRLLDAIGLRDLDPELWVDSRHARVAPLQRASDAPYLGHRAYTAADASVYCGRAQAIAELCRAVKRAAAEPGPRIVMVVGASGSGKSSLLGAGLAQATGPDGALAGNRLVVASQTLDDLNPAQLQASDLVVIDQVETILALPPRPRAAGLAKIRQAAQAAVVVLGMRSDACGAASLDPLLAAALDHPVELAPLTADELREAIVGPAASQNVVVEDELIAILRHDLEAPTGVAEAPGLLPLLSATLLATWSAGSGSRMTVGDYLAAGGVAAIVEQLADQVYAGLGPDQQELARRLLLRLVNVESASVSCGSLLLTSLAPHERDVVSAFVDARLLTLTEAEVQLSHESLLRRWDPLVGWIEQSRERLFALQHVKRATQTWLEDGRDPDTLLPSTRLQHYQTLIQDENEPGLLLTPSERDFLTASAEHHTRAVAAERHTHTRIRRRGQLAMGFAAVAIALSAINLLLAAQSQQAGQTAREAQADALSRQVAMAAYHAASDDPNLHLRLALVADTLADTVEARSVLGDATSVDAPMRWDGPGPAVLASTADGELIARADGAGKVSLWHSSDLLNPSSTVIEVSSAGPVTAVDLFQQEGRTLLATVAPSGAQLWELASTPRPLYALSGSDWTQAKFSPTGNLLAFGDRHGGVTLIDLAAAQQPTTVRVSVPQDDPVGRVSVRSLQFDGSGHTIFVGGSPSGIYRWRVGGGEAVELAPIRYPDGRPALSLALNRNGDQLAAALLNRRVLRWKLDGDQVLPMPRIDGFQGQLNEIAYSADGARLLAAADDHGTYVIPLNTVEPMTRLPGPTAVTSVTEALGGQLVTADADGDLRIWPVQERLLRAGGSRGTGFAADAAGHWLAHTTSTDGILLWDAAHDGFHQLPNPTAKLGTAADGSPETLSSGVAIDPQGRFLLGGTNLGNVVSWPLGRDGAGPATLAPALPGNYLRAITINPAGDLAAAVASVDGHSVALFRVLSDGRLEAKGQIASADAMSASFSPDGTLLAVAAGPDAVELWQVSDPANPRLLTIVRPGPQPLSVAFAPDRPVLAIGLASGGVTLEDFSDPMVPTPVGRHTEPRAEIFGLSWSPDGRWLIGSGGLGRVWQWDQHDPKAGAIGSYGEGEGRANAVAFVHDGREFVAAGDSGDVRVWITGREDARDYLCAAQGSGLSEDEWSHYLPGVPKVDPCQ